MRALALKLSILHARQVSFWDALWIRFSGDAMQALTFSGPFIGEPTKAWLLKRRGLSLAEGFAATLTAAVLNLVVGAVMGTAGLAYLLRHGALPPPAAAAAVGLICVNAAFLLSAVAAVGKRYYLIGFAVGWLGRSGNPLGAAEAERRDHQHDGERVARDPPRPAGPGRGHPAR